jgi:hypothetical protein
MQNLLLPINHINPMPTDEKVAITYLTGYPRQYRFDASRGIFNIGGTDVLTKKGETMSIVPIGYRIFFDNILNYGPRKWVEFFFLNGSMNVCELLLHGYSVENLMQMFQKLYYDKLNLCEVELIIKPVEKLNKSINSKYFMAEFDYKPLETELKDAIVAHTEGLTLFRSDTYTDKALTELALNYTPVFVPTAPPKSSPEGRTY